MLCRSARRTTKHLNNCGRAKRQAAARQLSEVGRQELLQSREGALAQQGLAQQPTTWAKRWWAVGLLGDKQRRPRTQGYSAGAKIIGMPPLRMTADAGRCRGVCVSSLGQRTGQHTA